VRMITRSPDHHRYDARGSEDNKNSRSFRSRKTVWSRQCLNFGSLKSVKIHESIGSMSGTRRIWGRNSASLEDLCGPLIHHGVPVDESSCQWECWSAGLPVKSEKTGFRRCFATDMVDVLKGNGCFFFFKAEMMDSLDQDGGFAFKLCSLNGNCRSSRSGCPMWCG
jgi:hypothetical protein